MKKTILLTNDDGYNSIGIRLLYDILKNFYHVVIVAPESEKSGVGHSFTYNYPLFYTKIENDYAEDMYSVSGSPADCVKFAVSYLLPKTPDMIISGMNIGENSGISSHYSGTVAAAREGAFWKIRSFAFSLCEDGYHFAEHYSKLSVKIIDYLMEKISFIDNTIFYNVNFPNCNPLNIKGIKFTRQSMAFYNDRYKQISVNSLNGIDFGYQLFGEKIDLEESNEYDSKALLDNFITVTPLSFDATASNCLGQFKNINMLLT